MAFLLHPQLAKDCAIIGDLPLCRVLLMNNRHFPWLILVPRRNELQELFDLSHEDYHTLMDEIRTASQRLHAITGAHKMNVATLGNQVPQLHVHIIARFKDDKAWPEPVWNCGIPPLPYSPQELAEAWARFNITKM